VQAAAYRAADEWEPLRDFIDELADGTSAMIDNQFHRRNLLIASRDRAGDMAKNSSIRTASLTTSSASTQNMPARNAADRGLSPSNNSRRVVIMRPTKLALSQHRPHKANGHYQVAIEPASRRIR
jgi:hypothetical protein